MSEEERIAAAALLDEAMKTMDPHVAKRCRVVAALLHGHQPAKITRNLGVTEKMILSCKSNYDKKGLAGLK
jgi:transposase